MEWNVETPQFYDVSSWHILELLLTEKRPLKLQEILSYFKVSYSTIKRRLKNQINLKMIKQTRAEKNYLLYLYELTPHALDFLNKNGMPSFISAKNPYLEKAKARAKRKGKNFLMYI